VRGRPKRTWRRADPNPCGSGRRTELSLRLGADIPLVLVSNTVWRIRRWPVWNIFWRQEGPLRVAESQVAWRVAPLEITCGPRLGSDIGVGRLSKPILGELAWDRTPLGLEAAPSCRPRGSRWHF
jgi:hypothetical protein